MVEDNDNCRYCSILPAEPLTVPNLPSFWNTQTISILVGFISLVIILSYRQYKQWTQQNKSSDEETDEFVRKECEMFTADLHVPLTKKKIKQIHKKNVKEENQTNSEEVPAESPAMT